MLLAIQQACFKNSQRALYSPGGKLYGSDHIEVLQTLYPLIYMKTNVLEIVTCPLICMGKEKDSESLLKDTSQAKQLPVVSFHEMFV